MSRKTTVPKSYSLRVTVSSDRLKAYVNLDGADSILNITPEIILQALIAQNIVPPDESDLKKVIEEAKLSGRRTLLVAEGKPPVSGSDGYPLWHIEWDSANSLENLQRVDYRDFRRLLSVEKGQRLLTLVEPCKGTPGTSVFGQTMPARAGRPSNMKPGKNVALSADRHTLLAAEGGIVTLVGCTVRVDDVCQVDGDIGFQTGNVRFGGNVIIAGNVLDLFEVHAAGDIQVWGIIEGANVSAAQNLVVRGGICGKEKGNITVQGQAVVKYLINARVRCFGDLIADSGITNSDVRCNGQISVRKGAIAGGSIMARNGITTRLLGSPANVQTFVAIGMDLTADEEMRRLEEEIREAQKEISQIKTTILRLKTASHRELTSRLYAAINALRAKQEDLVKLRRETTERLLKEGGKSIHVTQRLYAGVDVHMGGLKRRFTRDMTGPLRIVVDGEKSRIVTR